MSKWHRRPLMETVFHTGGDIWVFTAQQCNTRHHNHGSTKILWVQDKMELKGPICFLSFQVVMKEKSSVVIVPCQLVPSADNLCKQFGPRSGPTLCRAWSWSKLFDTLMVFQKEFFQKKKWFWKLSADEKKHAKLPSSKIMVSSCSGKFWRNIDRWLTNSAIS